jgi:hypothetical protein
VPAVAPDTTALWQAAGPAADLDSSGTLLAWLDGPGQILQVLDSLIRDTTTDPGWSILLDVDRCPDYALPWLGQLVGVRFDSTLTDPVQRRAAIRNRSGFARGSVAAIRSAAQRFLTGTQRVDIAERDTGPYHLTVTVYQSQMTGLSYADLGALYPTYAALTAAFATYAGFSAQTVALTSALLAAKPAGLLLTVVISTATP